MAANVDDIPAVAFCENVAESVAGDTVLEGRSMPPLRHSVVPDRLAENNKCTTGALRTARGAGRARYGR